MIMKKTENRLLQASTLLFILNIMASALNYLCQLLMARVLSVESYGTVNTIFSFMMIIAVPGTTLTMIVAKYYAGANAISNRKGYLNKQLVVVFTLTIVVFLILFGSKNLLASTLHIYDSATLLLAFILSALGYFQPLYSGVFSGNKHFILVGIYSLFIPIYKLAAVGVTYIYSDDDNLRLHILLVVMVLGTVITTVFGQVKSNSIVGKIKKKSTYSGKLYSADDFNTLILNLSLMLYMNIDLLTVRYYGSKTESGLYSSVLLLGRIIYYFATTLGTILLPSVADKDLSNIECRKILNKTLLLMSGFAVVCMVPINIGKNFFIQILYGLDYSQASKYVIFVSIISLSLSFYTIMINYVVGIGKTKMATVVMLIVDALLGASVFLLKNIYIILLCIGIIGGMGALIIYVMEWKAEKKTSID